MIKLYRLGKIWQLIMHFKKLNATKYIRSWLPLVQYVDKIVIKLQSPTLFSIKDETWRRCSV